MRRPTRFFGSSGFHLHAAAVLWSATICVTGVSFAIAGEHDSPLYASTLRLALNDMATASAPRIEAVAAAAIPARGARPVEALITTVPNTSTICGASGTIVCTQAGNNSTQCAQNSRTACTTENLCGPTTRPQGTQTMCRGQHTHCRNGQPLQCTVNPAQFTSCGNNGQSGTFCPRSDNLCFTNRPQGGTTICQGMQTQCLHNQPVVCTRDPMSSTQCAHSSRTSCSGSDPSCHANSESPQSPQVHPISETGYLEPTSIARGQTVSLLLGFNGSMDDLVVGEMSAHFGPGIVVMSSMVISPVEGFFDVFCEPTAPLGPHLVTLVGGDALSPNGEQVIHLGTLTVTDVSGVDPPSAPRNFLSLASQNPLRAGTTEIHFGLAKTEYVELRMFDVSGRTVRTLARGVHAAGNEHSVTWDGTDDRGRLVESGVYFYRLRTASFDLGRKISVLKR